MTPRRFGLRARVIAAFGIGALLLSVLLSAVTYSLTLGNLVDRRQSDVRTNAIANAQGINEEVFQDIDRGRLTDILRRFDVPEGSQQGMLHLGEFYWTNTLQFTDDRLPTEFVAQVFDGTPVEMTFDGGDAIYYAVALPLPNANASASYVQATPLDDVDDTVNGLLVTLAGASAVTAILGLGFGIYTATRLFAPLGEVSAAAEQIAEGELSTRLDEGRDPDLDRLIVSFNNMSSALEERIMRDSRFASDVSHELRSPLMTLTGSVAVLEKRREDMPERAQVALDLLSADIRRFKVLVEDLLEISRFDVGAVVLETEEVLLSEFVRRSLHAASGGQREVPLIHGPNAEDLIVEIDKRRIAQVIRNLSENADKYADGVTQSRVVRVDDGVRIELEDEGPGVPVDERELIFDRFARGSEGGRRGSGTGVGLGLSLVVEHLRLHGGTIHVEDRVDGLSGARFVITLPGVVVDE